MEIKNAIQKFDALSQETRLQVFRLLVKAGPNGLPAGAISDAMGTPRNTMSFHLSHLSAAGLVSSRKEGRSIIYAANYTEMQNLIAFMVEDCCSDDFANIRSDNDKNCKVIELTNCCD